MENITDGDKKRVIDFIKESEIDMTPVDNGIFKFSVVSDDGVQFFFYTYNSEYILVKYNKEKDKPGQPGLMPYSYFNFKTLQELLSQLKFYDDSIPKKYWYPTTNSAEIPFDKNNYKDDWTDVLNFDKFWKTEIDNDYKIAIYENPNFKPKLKSTFNNLHEVSDLNTLEGAYTQVDKLYFEIHPISCKEGSECYLLKLLINNEETLKEFINYIVNKKRGIKILIGEIFKEVKNFKS